LDWIHLAQGTVQWRALVDTVMKFVLEEEGNYLLVELLLASQ